MRQNSSAGLLEHVGGYWDQDYLRQSHKSRDQLATTSFCEKEKRSSEISLQLLWLLQLHILCVKGTNLSGNTRKLLAKQLWNYAKCDKLETQTS